MPRPRPPENNIRRIEGNSLLFVGSKIIDTQAVINFKPTAQHDVCASDNPLPQTQKEFVRHVGLQGSAQDRYAYI